MPMKRGMLERLLAEKLRADGEAKFRAKIEEGARVLGTLTPEQQLVLTAICVRRAMSMLKALK